MKNGYLRVGADVVKSGEEEQSFFFFLDRKGGAELRERIFFFTYTLTYFTGKW